MPIIVYKMDASPPASSVLITAEILGLEIETRDVNIIEKEHLTPEYLKKNPLHTVPILEDGDFVLSDSHAIAIYLVSKYGTEQEGALYPSDLKQRALINQRLFFDASILFSSFIAAEKDIIHGNAVAIDEDKIASVKEAYGFLDKYLERSTFVAGENITLADIACVTTVSTVNTIVPLDDQYPKIKAWLEVLGTKEWYQKINQPSATNFAKLFAMRQQKNAQCFLIDK